MRTAPISTQVATRPADRKVTSVTFSESPQRSYLGSILGAVVMHAVVRTYSGTGAKELMDVLEKSKAEVEGLIRAVRGL
jgi:hypothetical protein